MKNDFKKMEDEMDLLATNMATITEFSAGISDTLQDRRQQITKLSGVHTLLKKVCYRGMGRGRGGGRGRELPTGLLVRRMKCDRVCTLYSRRSNLMMEALS